jgi:hypothetical protein
MSGLSAFLWLWLCLLSISLSLIFIFASKGSKDTVKAKGKESEPLHFDAAPVPGRNDDVALMLSFGNG